MRLIWAFLPFIIPLTTAAKDWWETASFYQIYPRSYHDSNGDGVGDLKGITQKLTYLKDLGVTAFWLSPIYKSPMADFGYDISDFFDIQPEYGTMSDFEELVRNATALGLKVILDFVPNHSSDENEWFLKSARREVGFEDFYVWHPGKANPANASAPLPPSNWISLFKYSAWQWNDVRKEYYLHQFVAKQPDLNYRSPAVVEQMKKVLRFWLGKGIAGFRIDAAWCLFEKAKDESGNYLDEPLSGTTTDVNSPDYLSHIYTQNQPETYDMVYQWRAVMDEWKTQHGGDSKIIMTEAYTSIENAMKYYGNATVNGSHIPFNFEIILNLKQQSTATDFSKVIDSWLKALPSGRSANWVMGNHDQRRVGSRIGEARIDALNMMLLTLPGVSISYMGEEIGMTDVYISWNDTVDPAACQTNATEYEKTTRDPARTPFQWDDSVNAGFSTAAKPWLPVSPNYRTVNVKAQQAATKSHLKIYKQLIQLRKDPLMTTYDYINLPFGNILISYRDDEATKRVLMTLVNFGNAVETFNFTKVTNAEVPAGLTLKYHIVSDKQTQVVGAAANVDNIVLQPQGAVIILGGVTPAPTTVAPPVTTTLLTTTPMTTTLMTTTPVTTTPVITTTGSPGSATTLMLNVLSVCLAIFSFKYVV